MACVGGGNIGLIVAILLLHCSAKGTVVTGGQIHVTVGLEQLSVRPGISVILPCNYSVPSDDVRPLVSWWKDRGSVLTRRIVFEHQEGRFSKGYDEWVGRTALLRQASLQMSNLTTNDTGKYECEIRVPLKYGAARGFINLDVRDKNDSSDKLYLSIEFIVGVSIGGAVMLVIAVVLVLKLCKNASKSAGYSNELSSTNLDTPANA
ncbi:protein turtle-like [Branchiostoma floridae x Branchiostoma japonicum]